MKPFSLLVKPASADCNLRCAYCFYLEKRRLYPDTVRHRMTDPVLETMIRTYLATDQPQYAFGWQGGEPTLMGLDFFRRVTDLQQRHGRAGAIVSNGLQTNGTLLTDDLAAHLGRFKFLVGVSLDGPAPVHNRYRITVDGRGSHADVMRGIGRLRRQGVEFNILTLVSRANVDRPREIYRYLCEQGFLFQQYIECVESDEAGEPMPYAVSGEEWGAFLCGIYDEWIRSDTRRVSIRLFDSIVQKMVEDTDNVCQMGRDCRQYLVVEHNGDVYPCDFFVEPALKLGNVRTGSWAEFLGSPLYRDFGLRKAAWNSECAVCEYLRFCAGDCPKNRPTRGREPGRLSRLCAGWKMFYRHTLEGFERLAEEIRRERAGAARAAALRGKPATRVGRNDPCPCGSGKKYKKCCGRFA